MQNYLLAILVLLPVFTLGQQSQDASWEVKTDGKIFGSATYTNGTIYVGNITGSLLALNAKNGEKIWELAVGGRWASKPLVRNKSIYQLNGNGTFYSIDIKNGKIQWSFKTGGEHRMLRSTEKKSYRDIWDYYLSGATFQNETVYFGSSDGFIYALNAITGKLKWKFKTSGEVHATPIVNDSLVYAGSMDGTLYALNAADGSLLWDFDTIGSRFFPKGGIQRGPIFYDGMVLFGSRDFNLYALNPKTGKGLWNYRDPGSWIVASPAASDDNIFIGTSDSHLFYNFDTTSGKVKWKKKLNMRVYGSAAIDEERVYFGCFNGFLYGLNIKNGDIEWQFQTNGSNRNYYTIFNKDHTFKEEFELYGSTIASMQDGEKKLQTLGSILASPVIANEKLYIGSTDSTFYAVEI
ncbi:PQQ-binding-like beta-propeller repeat protein [Fodinibius saliphilus]|uniref:PQQ-binding-like beta-propeller repeat protein n=1 Tax=Fodinibius saliphilus TaxID=1920650 RepID=UPI0011092B31|nr:PQQ-binding-like beta-propeller repeat protein [Fodinibius saliphilus]